jgi:hypothetical protein
MKKIKFKKHPAKMTNDELAKGVFHPVDVISCVALVHHLGLRCGCRQRIR